MTHNLRNLVYNVNLRVERLNKRIAASGIASRRQADGLIRDGKVCVNGHIVTNLATRVSDKDEITVDGAFITSSTTVTYAVYKPKGYVSSTVIQGTSPIVTSLVPTYPRVNPVGRLDKDSEGLILLSNDGELGLQLTHPRFSHEKEYRVTAHGPGKPDDIRRQLLRGVRLGDGTAKADAVTVTQTGNNLELTITVHEGRHHLIRRMCARLGLVVTRLIRTRISTITLGDLGSASYVVLSEEQIRKLYASK